MSCRVLIVGLGTMGRSHALAYHAARDATVVGLVNRSVVDLPDALADYPRFDSFEAALAQCSPDLVVIATHTDSHADYAIAAMRSGAHVFVEKPLAATSEDARRVLDCAALTERKLMVGYILRQHPSWQRLIAEARALGGPFVFRMNLNQQSTGAAWETHKALMRSTSPLVDCGVHYVDVMCQITDARPVSVHAIGLRLSDEIAEDMFNYGQLQVSFEDGSVGWYEAGWGPMMSETAYFVKDVISPRGSVSIVDGATDGSSDIDGHTAVGALRVHTAHGGRMIDLAGEPGHQALCDLEARAMLDAMAAGTDLDRHGRDAFRSLAICLAADRSIRERRIVQLED